MYHVRKVESTPSARNLKRGDDRRTQCEKGGDFAVRKETIVGQITQEMDKRNEGYARGTNVNKHHEAKHRMAMNRVTDYFLQAMLATHFTIGRLAWNACHHHHHLSGIRQRL